MASQSCGSAPPSPDQEDILRLISHNATFATEARCTSLSIPGPDSYGCERNYAGVGELHAALVAQASAHPYSRLVVMTDYQGVLDIEGEGNRLPACPSRLLARRARSPLVSRKWALDAFLLALARSSAASEGDAGARTRPAWWFHTPSHQEQNAQHAAEMSHDPQPHVRGEQANILADKVAVRAAEMTPHALAAAYPLGGPTMGFLLPDRRRRPAQGGSDSPQSHVRGTGGTEDSCGGDSSRRPQVAGGMPIASRPPPPPR